MLPPSHLTHMHNAQHTPAASLPAEGARFLLVARSMTAVRSLAWSCSPVALATAATISDRRQRRPSTYAANWEVTREGTQGQGTGEKNGCVGMKGRGGGAEIGSKDGAKGGLWPLGIAVES